MKNINSSKRISITCYGVSALIFFAIGLLGVFLPAGNDMSYIFTYYYIVMPLTTLISSLIISIKKGYLFWFYPVFVGILEILIYFSFNKGFNMVFDMIHLFFAFFPALIGLIIGLIIRLIIS